MLTTANVLTYVLPTLLVFLVHAPIDNGGFRWAWNAGFNRVLRTHFSSPEQQKYLQLIRKWAMEHNPSKHTSSHWWYSELGSLTPAFDALVHSPEVASMFASIFSPRWYTVIPVWGMNEIYVSGPNRKGNSDTVFYTKHIDGPFPFFPFASCFRCIVGMDNNTQVSTVFPMVPTSITAQQGNLVAFDFHREPHFIQDHPNAGLANKEQRIVLKLHFVTYPTLLMPLGRLLAFMSTCYNQLFRLLFVSTITPETALEKFGAWNVVFWTHAFNKAEEYVGWNNLSYLALLVHLSVASSQPLVLLLGTSFVHYVRYIKTFYWRTELQWATFKRDVLVFKTVSLSQLVAHYLHSTLLRARARSLHYCGPSPYPSRYCLSATS